MPWLETSSVEQRERFIADERLGLYTRTELCARYGISRKTGYKWLDRFDEDGRRGLRDRSHAPHHCPHRIASEGPDLLCPAPGQHRDGGPGKRLAWLAPRHPELAAEAWPAVSTAGDLLAREGLVKKRRRRRAHQHPGVVPPTTDAPHDRRSAHALSARLSGAAEHQGPGRPPGLRADLPGVRPAARDPDRQRRPLRLVRHPWPVPAQRLVDAARDPASAHSPRLAPGERGARTHAPDPESRGLLPTPCPSRRAATRVQSLSDAVQRRAAARLSRRPDAQLALHRLAPRLSRATAPARISGALPGQAGHQRRHVPAQAQAALHRQRTQTASHRPRRNRRRHLVDLFRDGPSGESGRARDDHSRLTRCAPLTQRSVTYPPG